jgi:hypothetical protein
MEISFGRKVAHLQWTCERFAGDNDEIGHWVRIVNRKWLIYFYLGTSHVFLREKLVKNTMFLVGGVGGGGGPRVGWRGQKVSEKRRFVVCAPMVFPTHGPQPDGTHRPAPIRMRLCHGQPRKIDSGLTRKA